MQTPQQIKNTSKVLIVNEGNFGSGNASVSLLDKDSGTVTEDFYRMVNSQALGDVAQSISRINSKYYIVVNNSGKIVVCDVDFKKKTEIMGLPSPRYILQVTPNKAYVSDLKSGYLSVLDLANETKVGRISCGGWTERMVCMFGKVYVTNLKTNYLYIVSVADDKLKDSLMVGPNAGSIVTDSHDKIWVLSSGDKNNPAALLCVDPVNDKIIRKQSAPGSSPYLLCANGRGDTLYYAGGNIYRFVPDDQAEPAEFIQAGLANFYGLDVDPADSKIYASDAIDYSQRSSINVFGSDGQRKKILKAGVNASGFYFE